MKNKILLLIIVMVTLLTTGCGGNNYIKDENNKPITYEATGQYLQKNLLCQPKDQELYKLYKDNDEQLNISIDDLPQCNQYKVSSNKSTGIWEFLFVKPLAWLILKVGEIANNMGVAVIIVGLLIRVIVLPFSYKTQKQSINMQKAQPEIQRIEKKYRNRTDQQSMMMKSQETMQVYKKYNISPLSGCLISFIQLPIFFAFWQAINRVPAIFEGKLLGFNLGMTPAHGFATGNYMYLLLLVLIVLSTYFSFKYTMKGSAVQTPEMAKQMNMMVNIMTVMIVFTSLSLSTALAIYWITTYAFISIQTFVFRKIMAKELSQNKGNKKEVKNKKLINDKLKAKEGMKYGKNN